jgi:poly-gamma-glutamate system protein
MKLKAYQRSRIMAKTALWTILVFILIDSSRWLLHDPLYETKIQAALIMHKALQILAEERGRRGMLIDEKVDPNRTGLIGREYTDLTTTLGNLAAKRTTTNPNFSGAVVDMIDQSGARHGDTVAVSFSGSFPALNLAVLAAVKAMGLRPLIISSVGASSFGANEPLWTWLDMEKVLVNKGIITDQTAFASLGGIVDENGGMNGAGIELGLQAIRRNRIPYIKEDGKATLLQDIERRMTIYEKTNMSRSAAFINVGGTLTSLGDDPQAVFFAPGLILKMRPSNHPMRGIIVRMQEKGIPVIHLLDIRKLAAKYGLPFDPRPIPIVPDGMVMKPRRFARQFAMAALLMIGIILIWANPRIKRCVPGLDSLNRPAGLRNKKLPKKSQIINKRIGVYY